MSGSCETALDCAYASCASLLGCMRRAFILWDVALQETPACAMGRTNLFFFEEPLKAVLTPPFRKPRAVPLEAGPLCASLSGSLAASIALGSARLDFEATPVVDADHGESESRSRRRRGRCCGLWEQHMGNGVAPEGICAACRARSIRRSQLVS